MKPLTLWTLRFTQLVLGLGIFGTGLALVIWAAVGLPPWDVLHQGIMKHTGISFGTVIIISSLIVLLTWIPLKQQPGLGTILNALLIGIIIDFWLYLWPEQPFEEPIRYLLMLTGIVLAGLGTGMYIGANMGPGPRDGLMTGLNERFGWKIWKVRTGIELFALIGGWFLGGQVWVGTLVFSLLIGPMCQIFLRIFNFKTFQPEPKVDERPDDSIEISPKL